LTINKQTLKALSSDTRVGILKSLKSRRMHLSEIAAKLQISPSTAKEHMVYLLSSGLVDLKDEGRKWKYYELTKRGQCVVSPIEIRMVLVLASTFIGAVFAFNNFINKFKPVSEAFGSANDKTLASPAIITQTSFPFSEFLLVLLTTLILGITLGYIIFRYKEKNLLYGNL